MLREFLGGSTRQSEGGPGGELSEADAEGEEGDSGVDE